MYARTSDPGAGAPPLDANTRVYDYDANGAMIYEGWAVPGSSTSDPVWAIRRHTRALTGGPNAAILRSDWADGNSAPDNIWDQRATLKYA